MRKLAFAAAFLLLIWAAVVVPLPLAMLEPEPAVPVERLVEVEEASLAMPEELRATVIRFRRPTAAGAVTALVDEHRELSALRAVTPPGLDPERFTEFQRRLFRESVRTAVAMGLDAAGRDVSISGEGARVVATIPGSPADRVLQQEDTVTAVDGRSISLASELAAHLSGRSRGEEVTLTIRRDGQELEETLRLGPIAELGQAGIGIVASTADLRIDLPVDIQPTSDARVGGPSAGLMLALGAYEAATEPSLTGGRVIAGTGTIDLSGNVGPVDGIEPKVRGAVLADAEILLVPEDNADAARAAAPVDLEVVPVASLDDAIGLLADR